MLKVSERFSPYPAGRTRGPANGKLFREKFLKVAVAANEPIIIDFDGVAGLPSSFLEEAFGGLVRERLISSVDQFKKIFLVRTTDPILDGTSQVVDTYVQDELNRSAA